MVDISKEFTAEVRRYLRISHSHFDDEITDLIGAAQADLLLGGVTPEKVANEGDALIKRAIVCYVKAEFGIDNPDAEKYRNSYDMLKKHLQLSNEYTTAEGS